MSDNPREGKGVFDDIKGAHSRDPDEVAEEPKAPVQESKEAEPTPEKGEGKVGTEDDETTRLRSHVNRLERQIKNMGPYAQFGLAVSQDDKGKPIADRWQQGRPIFSEEAMQEETMESQPQQSLNPQDIHNILDEREGVRRQMDTLTELASENLEGFNKVKNSQRFTKALNGALATVWNDPTWYEDAPKEVRDWEDEGAAKNYTAISQAYRYLLANSPKVIEAAKAAGKKEAKDRTEAAMAASVSSGGTSSSSEEPSEKSEADQMIERMINSGPTGKSFRSVGRK